MPNSYRDASLRYLDLRFARIEALLDVEPADGQAELLAAQARAIRGFEEDCEASGQELPIAWLRRRTGLPPLAEDCLLLSVAAQVRPGMARMIARHPAADGFAHVSPELCLSVFLPDRVDRLEWMPLFLPGSALLRHRLARVLPIPDAISNPLRGIVAPSPVVTSLLLGIESTPDILEGVATRVRPAIRLADLALEPDHAAAQSRALARLNGRDGLRAERDGPGGFDHPAAFVHLLTGPPSSGRRSLATALAGEAERGLVRLDARALSIRSRPEQQACLDLAFQMALLFGDWLLITHGEAALAGAEVGTHFEHLARTTPINCLVTASSPSALAPGVRALVASHDPVARPGHRLMEQVWQRNLQDRAGQEVDWARLVERSPVPPVGARNAVRSALRSGSEVDGGALARAASDLGQATLDAHAMRMPARRRLGDIFLEEELAAELAQIVGIARTRQRAMREWGLTDTIHRGLGMVCLFQGEPGTGKTLAAEVIASEVGLPLMRVNLATVVSKYIGETAKHLADVFDQASQSPCVLLFDEADSLFAKRTEVGRATDRYANMDVNLLLQLTEDHDGIVVLTTNLVGSIDKAFQRRISYNLRFEPPDETVRAAIWRHLVPAAVPTEEIDFDELARRHDLTGGSIKSVVVRAVLEASRLDRPLSMEIIESAVAHELANLGKVVHTG